MKLIHKTINFGIATLLSLLAPAVQAQSIHPVTPVAPTLINHPGLPNRVGSGIVHNNFYYPGGGSFYRGNLYNQGGGLYQGNLYHLGLGGISQGTFYYPNYGGNFHGLFYNPNSGRVYEGNFYNPGPAPIYREHFANPYPVGPSPSPTSNYNLNLACLSNRDLHDWGLGCFPQRDYKKAIQYYSQQIQRHPQLPELYNERALARYILGDQSGTIADLNKAASLYHQAGDTSKYQQTLETIRELQIPTRGVTNIK